MCENSTNPQPSLQHADQIAPQAPTRSASGSNTTAPADEAGGRGNIFIEGPYRFAGVRMGGDASIMAGETLIASVHPQHMRYPDPTEIAQQNATAMLLAASWDLLRELKEAALSLEEAAKLLPAGGFPGCGNIMARQAENARAAIARAEGQVVVEARAHYEALAAQAGAA